MYIITGTNLAFTVARDQIIRPDVTFHDPAGNAPFSSEEEDDLFVRLDSLSLRRGVVVGPYDAVGGHVVAVPSRSKRHHKECQPKPSPKLKLATI